MIDETMQQIAIKIAELNLAYYLVPDSIKREKFNEMVNWQNMLDQLCKAKAKEINDSVESINFQLPE